MTLTPATTGNRRSHAFLDTARHGVWPYGDGSSVYVPELPFRFLKSLTLQEYDTVIPYERIAVYMWRTGVPAPYDGSYDRNIQDHLSGIRAIMKRVGWEQSPFEVKIGVGICVHSDLIPSEWR
jgi:hypothetical protein